MTCHYKVKGDIVSSIPSGVIEVAEIEPRKYILTNHNVLVPGTFPRKTTRKCPAKNNHKKFKLFSLLKSYKNLKCRITDNRICMHSMHLNPPTCTCISV